MGIKPLVSILLLAVSGPLLADVITFDDAYASLGNGGDPATFYSAGNGLTISGAYFGLVGGVGNGDPGGWALEGTNGSAFLGCNDGDFCSPTFTSLTPGNFSVDIGLSYGTTATFTVTGSLGGTFVSSQSASISDADLGSGTWHKFTLSGTVDKIVISSSGANAYGIDNLNTADAATTPEPATISMLLGAGGLGLLGAIRRRVRR